MKTKKTQVMRIADPKRLNEAWAKAVSVIVHECVTDEANKRKAHSMIQLAWQHADRAYLQESKA